ncbi:hypothetical protein RRG08_007076 [Elysia crispata]|uniref:Uncharacterized protein n=1 Tax=Elysia crispata TaxID=231223 RepID=A0AAE0YP40_9GAST|nr:hypothetical protein RRG08_007076 [Elysia crispata]
MSTYDESLALGFMVLIPSTSSSQQVPYTATVDLVSKFLVIQSMCTSLAFRIPRVSKDVVSGKGVSRDPKSRNCFFLKQQLKAQHLGLEVKTQKKRHNNAIVREFINTHSLRTRIQ